MTTRPRVVIAGGGFGGLYGAQSLRRAPVDVTLADRRNFAHLMYLVEFENRALASCQWASNYFTGNRSARLITGESAGAAGSRTGSSRTDTRYS